MTDPLSNYTESEHARALDRLIRDLDALTPEQVQGWVAQGAGRLEARYGRVDPPPVDPADTLVEVRDA